MSPLPWTAMINPVLEPLGDDKKPIWERCLSLPGLYGRVPRYSAVRVTFTTLEGRPEERTAKGYHAMLLQHECDLLDGIGYSMRMTDMSQFAFASELIGDGDFYPYAADEFTA